MKFQKDNGPIINIWLPDLIYAIHGPRERQGYLNITTGSILFDDNDDDISPTSTIIKIWKNVQQYHEMQFFIESLPAGDDKTELSEAINGAGAFGRFKELTRKNFAWSDFRRERQDKIAFKFLGSIGLKKVE